MTDSNIITFYIEKILMKDIEPEIKTEWIKNTIIDYLWPVFDFKHIVPNNIMPKEKICISYNTLKFSEIIRKKFSSKGILIDDKAIIIDCLNINIAKDIINLKETLKQMKDILC